MYTSLHKKKKHKKHPNRLKQGERKINFDKLDQGIIKNGFFTIKNYEDESLRKPTANDDDGNYV